MQQRNVNRGIVSQNYCIPAPTGGLNMRDSLDSMAETDALVMDNYIPLDNKVVLRKGYLKYAETPAAVLTLLTYVIPHHNKLLAFSGGNVYDVSDKTNIKSYPKEFNNDRWQGCQFRNRLFMVNGIDTPQVYYIKDNEVIFEPLQISGEGLSVQSLINVCVSKQRLFFIQKNSLNVWYSSGVGEVQGTLNKFDMSTIFRDGGELVSLACWTQDGGQGIDDLTVFISSEGEVAVYSGSNPNNASDWTLKGVYRMSKPIGYRCVIPYQGDIVVISEDGYIPLSKALPLEKANSALVSFSDKIRGLILESTRKNKEKFGWQGIIYNLGGYAIFNVPIDNTYEQHVINTNTGAWCRFKNIPSICWVKFADRLYFGSKDGVYQFDEGYSDNKQHICGHIEQAYNHLGSPHLKRIQMLNPRTKAISKYTLVIYTNMDFVEGKQDYITDIGREEGSKWNNCRWSSPIKSSKTYWATAQTRIFSQWIANSATGFKASIVFKTKTSGNQIEWFDTSVRYENGKGLL